MTALGRLLCRLDLHAWLVVEGAGRVSAVCARDDSHRRLLRLTAVSAEVPASATTTTLELHFNVPALPDIPADKIAPPEAEIESALATIPADIPARPEPLVVAVGRRGGPSRVACIDGYKLHKWAGPDPDGWLRCLRGCGAGRDQADAAERVWPPESVPKLSQPESASAAVGAPASLRKEPLPAPSVKPTVALKEDAAEPPTARAADDFEPDDDDADFFVQPRPGVAALTSEQLAHYVGRDTTVALLTRSAPCPRCETGQLAHDPLEHNDPTAYACFSCGHRPLLSKEQAAELERELGLQPGKTRLRQPKHGGQRL